MLGLGRLNAIKLLGIIGHPSKLMERSGNQFGLVVAPASLFGRVERNWDDCQAGEGVVLPHRGHEGAEDLSDRGLILIFQLVHEATQTVVVVAPSEVITRALGGPITLASLQLGLTAGAE